jgi:hypothetical protein
LISLVVLFYGAQAELVPPQPSTCSTSRGRPRSPGWSPVGMTFVILTGGIDLSIGSIVALAGIIAAAAYKGGTGLLGRRAAGETSGCGRGRRHPDRLRRRADLRGWCRAG